MSHFITTSSWKDYLTEMSQPGTWGNHLELQVVASMMRVVICVITDTSNPDRCIIWLYPDESSDGPILLLGCQMGHHYFSLAPIDVQSTVMKAPCRNSTQSLGNNSGMSVT